MSATIPDIEIVKSNAFYEDAFYDLTEGQEPDLICESQWHGTEHSYGDEPAEWIVSVDEFCCSPRATILTCDPCLQSYLKYAGIVMCLLCHRFHMVVCREFIKSYEPIRKHPA